MNAEAGKASRALAIAGQFLLYAAFAGAIALFSRWPAFHQLGADEALIKLSIVHEGQRLKPCVLRTPAELAKLPPNMRAQSSCPRERAPLVVEVDLDGQPALRRVRPAPGLANDGRAAVFGRLATSAGTHHVVARMRDRAGEEGFDYELAKTVDLRPAQILVIDFDPTRKELTFR